METKLPGSEDRLHPSPRDARKQGVEKLTINNAIKNELKKVAAF
jgi:hypothetical protein